MDAELGEKCTSKSSLAIAKYISFSERKNLISMNLPYFINAENYQESQKYLKEAQIALIRSYVVFIASTGLNYNDNHGTVEALQHCFELSIKSMWCLVGLDFPRNHDPTHDMETVTVRLLSIFPHLEDDVSWELWKDWMRRKSGQWKKYHNETIYGDEVKGILASQLFKNANVNILFKEVAFTNTFINEQLKRIGHLLGLLSDKEKIELEAKINMFQQLRKDNSFEKELRQRLHEFFSNKN